MVMEWRSCIKFITISHGLIGCHLVNPCRDVIMTQRHCSAVFDTFSNNDVGVYVALCCTIVLDQKPHSLCVQLATSLQAPFVCRQLTISFKGLIHFKTL